MLSFLKNRDLPVHWQFVKYGLCGGLGAFTMFGVVAIIHFGYPDFVDAKQLTQAELLRNTNIINTLAFIPSNIVTYFLNRSFVFNSGRHSTWVEFWSFMAIAFISFLAGTAGTAFVMKSFEVPSIVGTLAFTVPSVLVNFICRKYVVFKN